LYPFAPQQREPQSGPNCYAYALAYIALTTKLNIQFNNQFNEPSKFCSYLFLDQLLKKIGRKKVSNLVTAYYAGKCEGCGDLDNVMYLLKVRGTVLTKTFEHKSKVNACDTGEYKIKNFTAIDSPDIYSNLILRIANYKRALVEKEPIVIAFKQTDAVCTENFIKPKELDNNIPTNNHIVTILGYDDTIDGGSFLVLNNYGEGCTIWVRYGDMLSVISWAYIIQL
jgi:hypothetical protein